MSISPSLSEHCNRRINHFTHILKNALCLTHKLMALTVGYGVGEHSYCRTDNKTGCNSFEKSCRLSVHYKSTFLFCAVKQYYFLHYGGEYPHKLLEFVEIINKKIKKSRIIY